MHHRYQCVIFDWDGTLMDSTAQITLNLQRAIRDLQWPEIEPKCLQKVIGLDLDYAFDLLYPINKPGHPQALKQAYLHYFFQDQHHKEILFPQAEIVLTTLRNNGILLAVATGKSRRGLNVVFEQCGYGDFFDCTRTADETRSKPDPLMLSEILVEFSLDATQALMVGDTTFDLEMAQRLKMDAVAVTTGAHTHQELSEYHPIALINDLSELIPLVITD